MSDTTGSMTTLDRYLLAGMGTDSDRLVAERLGVQESTIMEARSRHGIPNGWLNEARAIKVECRKRGHWRVDFIEQRDGEWGHACGGCGVWVPLPDTPTVTGPGE